MFPLILLQDTQVLTFPKTCTSGPVYQHLISLTACLGQFHINPQIHIMSFSFKISRCMYLGDSSCKIRIRVGPPEDHLALPGTIHRSASRWRYEQGKLQGPKHSECKYQFCYLVEWQQDWAYCFYGFPPLSLEWKTHFKAQALPFQMIVCILDGFCQADCLKVHLPFLS